jgi:hypothetical protein
MAMKINQTRNEHWLSDFQGCYTIFYFRKTIHILNYDANDAIKNTNRDWFAFGQKRCWIVDMWKVCTEFIMVFLPSGDWPEKILNTPWPLQYAYRRVSHINPTTPHKWHIHLAYSRISNWVISLLLLPSQNRLRIRHAYVGQRLVIKV